MAVLQGFYRGLPVDLLVDDDDLGWLSEYRWSGTNQLYFHRKIRVDGRSKTSYLHREIMGLRPGQREFIVDHIDRNVLDNRKANLRLTTYSENNRNRSSVKTCSVRGVSLTAGGVYIARHAGWVARFPTLEEAAAAVEARRIGVDCA